MQETGLSLVIPMRFYYWVKVDNANRVMPDIMNNLIEFYYDEAGDFLLRTIANENVITATW